jgi:uncharacterized pyridoxal phosphate-containing UPF0001 family protein
MPKAPIFLRRVASRARSIEERLADSLPLLRTRGFNSVRLKAVTEDAWALGRRIRGTVWPALRGENRVPEAEGKRAGSREWAGGIAWELIGSLQSNKAKLAAIALWRECRVWTG